MNEILDRIAAAEKAGKPLSRIELTPEEFWGLISEMSAYSSLFGQPLPKVDDNGYVGRVFGLPCYVVDEEPDQLLMWVQDVVDG